MFRELLISVSADFGNSDMFAPDQRRAEEACLQFLDKSSWGW